MSEEKPNNQSNTELQDYLDLLDTVSAEDLTDDELMSEYLEKDNADEEYGVDNGVIAEAFEQNDEAPVDDFVCELPGEEDGFEDISSEEVKEKNIFKRFSKWFNNLSKPKKAVFSIISIILVFAIVAGTTGLIYFNSKYKLLGKKFDEFSDDTIYEDEELDNIVGEIGESDFNAALKEWAMTGNANIMHSKNVLNVLLVGCDSRKGTNTGNTDAILIVSLNKKTQKVSIVSLFRDSYLYIDAGKKAYCSKINAAYSMGGIKTLVETIEHNYKIKIDNYVMVNFESFKSIIDAMGGVTVDVKKYESSYNEKKFHMALPIGQGVTLNGEQALCFSRIRKCDSDIERARRQRMVIDSIINKVRSASVSDLDSYLNVILPYIATDFSRTDIITLGMKAISSGWANFERQSLSVPVENETCVAGYAGTAWIWVVDYHKCAHDLQIALYGESNIDLPADRLTLIDINKGITAEQKKAMPSTTYSSTPSVTSYVPKETERSYVPTEQATQSQTPVTTTEPSGQEDEEPTTQPQTEPQATEAPTTDPVPKPTKPIAPLEEEEYGGEDDESEFVESSTEG